MTIFFDLKLLRFVFCEILFHVFKHLCYTAIIMNLQAAGLSETEARCYRTLLTKKEWLPSELALIVGESRTNMYKILDRFVVLGLATKYDKHKKLHYQATNPSRLLELAREARAQRERDEQQLELNTQDLLQTYITTHEQPGVRFYQGQAEIGTIFEQLGQSKEEIVFVHTSAGVDYYGLDVMHTLRMIAVKNGVSRRALTPDNPSATSDYAQTDPLVLLERTWLRQRDYSAPVEWGAFEDKLYIISYGQEALGIIIQSQQIADAFKQLFKIMESGQRAQPWYGRLPLHASKKAIIQPELD